MHFFTSRAVGRVIDVVTAIATLVPIIYLATQYADMPDRIPVHWNAHGVADRYAARGVISVFFPSILSALLQLMFAMLAHDLIGAWEFAQGNSAEQKARARSMETGLFMMQSVRLVLVVMLSLVSVSVPLTSGGRTPMWWTYGMFISVGLLLVVVITGAIRSWMLQEQWEAVASSSSPELRDENWRYSGSIYYNPSDPQFLVHKKLGAGFTFNFAHPRAKAYIALFVLTIVFVIAAVVTM